jgi:cytochrome oxidase assembly protein ShyY1
MSANLRERTIEGVLRALTRPLMIGLHLLAIAAVTAAVLLGLWQYGVWHTARASEAEQLAHAAPVRLSTVMSADSPYPADAVGRPVRFRGAWLPDETLFVRGRVLHGQPGFWVVTPVAVCRDTCSTRNPAMLVVRGWTPAPERAPAAPAGRVEVTGWLQPAEAAEGGLDQNPHDRVLAQLQVVAAMPHVRQDLYRGYVIQKGAATDGLQPVTPASLPQPSGLTSLRNLAYACQWWIFGGFAVFLWWRFCADEVKRVTGTDEAGAATPDEEPTGLRDDSRHGVVSKP